MKNIKMNKHYEYEKITDADLKATVKRALNDPFIIKEIKFLSKR